MCQFSSHNAPVAVATDAHLHNWRMRISAHKGRDVKGANSTEFIQEVQHSALPLPRVWSLDCSLYCQITLFATIWLLTFIHLFSSLYFTPQPLFLSFSLSLSLYTINVYIVILLQNIIFC
jgi:hypothetical protein